MIDYELIKKALENRYYISFEIKSNNDGFALTLSDSDKDKFQIATRINEHARLTAEMSIEKYGAAFLHLLNKSSSQKRNNFVDILNLNKKGKIAIKINNCIVEPDCFKDDNSEWNDFSIYFVEFPFEYDDKEIIRVLDLLIGMTLSLFDYSIEGFEEGSKVTTVSEKYERNPINRKICLAYKGYKCIVCGFDFEEKYGEIGKEVIEVHHIKPVSSLGQNYIVRPLEDLVPICSNCHTMIHKKNPPYTVDELRNMICKEINS